MTLVFWMLSFKPTFSLSSFTFIRRLCSSSLSAIRVVSSVYLRLLIFLLVILIPVCASSSLVFHMIYSAYKLNKQGDNIHHLHTPFLIWNQSVVPCMVLTVASWPAYRFLRRQVRWSGSYGQRFMTLYRRQWSRPSPRQKMQKGKMPSEEALQITEEIQEAKGKGKRKDIPIWVQSSKEQEGAIRKPSSVISAKK